MTNPENTPEVIDAIPVDDQKDPSTHDPELDEIVEDLVGIGRMWANHGLTIGRMAMKSSAKTLEVTSGVLEKIARRVAPKDEPTEA
mgnify:CR=1 FL=1